MNRVPTTTACASDQRGGDLIAMRDPDGGDPVNVRF